MYKTVSEAGKEPGSSVGFHYGLLHAYINLTSAYSPALLPPVDTVLVFSKLSDIFRWKPFTRIVLPHNLEVVLPYYLFVCRYPFYTVPLVCRCL